MSYPDWLKYECKYGRFIGCVPHHLRGLAKDLGIPVHKGMGMKVPDYLVVPAPVKEHLKYDNKEWPYTAKYQWNQYTRTVAEYLKEMG